MMNLKSATKLANGVEMPWFGLGVFKVQEGQEVIDSVKAAIKAGYRSIDTASVYGNEEGVGQAIRESGVAREELFITTKVWNTEQGYDSTLAAFDQSLSKLGLDYADLYLVHWPIRAKYKDTWRALEKLYADGKVRCLTSKSSGNIARHRAFRLKPGPHWPKGICWTMRCWLILQPIITKRCRRSSCAGICRTES